MFPLPTVPSELYHSGPAPADGEVGLKYLGTAGFIVEHDDLTLVIDPFVTRPSLIHTIFSPLLPDEALIEQLIPKADDVLIGHAHHDHVLDAPALCRRTGARLIGSPSACNVGRAAGLPEPQLLATRGRDDIVCGHAVVRGLPSRHGKVYFGYVPLSGTIDEPPPWPPRYRQLLHGLVLNWHIRVGGVEIVHIDSADFIDEELDGLTADVVCLCAIGRRYRDNYVKTVVEKLRPRFVVACHWDWFFTPYHEEPRCLPGVNLPGFVNEIKDAGAVPIVLPFDGIMGVPGL